MSFHKREYGIYGENLPSDVFGWVPEEGDHHIQFIWPEHIKKRIQNDPNWTKKWWERLLKEVNQALEDLENHLGIKHTEYLNTIRKESGRG